MKQLFFVALFAIISTVQLSAQCTQEPSENRILSIGDSWSTFMYTNNSIATALNDYGHSYSALSNIDVAVAGAETWDFLEPAMQQRVQLLLEQNPQIKAVHLSIGGNDMLGDWKDTLSAEVTDSMLNAVMARGQEIINFIRGVRPDVIVVFSGYCYPNFAELIETFPSPTQHPYYSAWGKMDYPSFIDINSILNQFSDKMVAACDTLPFVKYYPAMALMQYKFGQPTPLGVAPGGSYAQYTQPLPYGDPTYPSPKESMMNQIISRDCFHLSPKGYQYLLDYHTEKFYQKFLMDDLYLLADSTQTGAVSALGEVSSQPKIGDTGNDLYKAVLSFDTRGMADTTLQRASIFLRRESSNGPNLVTENLTIQIKNGAFGQSVAVDVSDYTSMADAHDHPCIAGANTNGYWVRLDLPNSLLPYIKKDDVTQFIISAPFTTGSRVVFSDATNPDYAPILNLKYGAAIEQPTGISTLSENSVRVYPNPTSGKLTIEADLLQVSGITVSDITGKVLLTEKAAQTVDISNFSNGIYIINIQTNEGVLSKKIVKD